MAKKTAKKKAKSAPTKSGAEKKKASSRTQAKKSSVKKSAPKSTAEKKKSVVKKSTTVKKSGKKGTTEKKTVAKKKSTTKKSTVKRGTAAKEASSSSSRKTPVKSTNKKTASSKKTATKKKPQDKKSVAPKKPKIEFPTIAWGADSTISFEATEKLHSPELTSIAGGFVFYEDKLVLANVPGRGWEIIGGRIDVGESPEDTFRREAYNQIGVTLSAVKMIGMIRIEHSGMEPPNCPYPFPVGYGVQYIGIADELLPFRGGENSLGRSLITVEGFKEHYYHWDEFIDAVFRYAYSVYKEWKKKLNK
jgi:8-oxo-dGTP pyrophosphatase MutT (NUDIX family)